MNQMYLHFIGFKRINPVIWINEFDLQYVQKNSITNQLKRNVQIDTINKYSK
jgi:hypothetical protein